jgi:hypothetical protein
VEDVVVLVLSPTEVLSILDVDRLVDGVEGRGIGTHVAF